MTTAKEITDPSQRDAALTELIRLLPEDGYPRLPELAVLASGSSAKVKVAHSTGWIESRSQRLAVATAIIPMFTDCLPAMDVALRTWILSLAEVPAELAEQRLTPHSPASPV